MDRKLEEIVQEKVQNDSEFQASLASLSDEEKTQAINAKASEYREAEFARVAKEAEVAGSQKIRAEKAESKLKELTPKDGSKEDTLSANDLYALMGSQVPQEDVEEVVKASKLLGKTVAEALKDPTVKVILNQRVEQRKTADAANTGGSRPIVKKVTDTEILAEAAKGNIPKPGTPEAEALFWARRKKKN